MHHQDAPQVRSALKRARSEISTDETQPSKRRATFGAHSYVREYTPDFEAHALQCTHVSGHGSPVLEPASPNSEASDHEDAHEDSESLDEHDPAERDSVESAKTCDGPCEVSCLVGIIIVCLMQGDSNARLQGVIKPLVHSGPLDTFVRVHARFQKLIESVEAGTTTVHLPSKVVLKSSHLQILRSAAKLCLQASALTQAMRCAPVDGAPAHSRVAGTV
eukprot:CAMPEP_0177728404 /NCGR_PEP_ID=MMETSP0484_2-20121128/20863_1 /TAXON_ID=354590 /ORGANISM="Rhodomonas lens, Strain RHODO" /LENGTH=218 /DNA_ID=CAMNT_0019241175 /DNA_START=65 /DNA_END=721 /DNA_ORIENTATION=+